MQCWKRIHEVDKANFTIHPPKKQPIVKLSNEIAVVDWEQGYVVNQQILIARFFFVLNNELATSHNYDQ